MFLRRAVFHILVPTAFVLPLWLVVGWAISNASGWALVWLLVIAAPSVFLGQLFLALLIRARGSVRMERAVSWRDVAGVLSWNVVTIAVGLFVQGWFWLFLAAAIAVFFVALWGSFRQLWDEAGGGFRVRTASSGSGSAGFDTGGTKSDRPRGPDVYVINESPER